MEFVMLERFLKLSETTTKVLINRRHRQNTPGMLTGSQQLIIQEIRLLAPLKEASKEISGDKYQFLTLLGPRFGRMYFHSPTDVAKAISALSNEIRAEHKKKALSPNEANSFTEENIPHGKAGTLWAQHKANLVSTKQFTSVSGSRGSIPTELKQYLDVNNLPVDEDPLKFWPDSRYYNPVLTDIGEKLSNGRRFFCSIRTSRLS
ncbi:hypothetical protein PR048_005687 [Dryococelus australis]|uniref:Uncharacterized protein n=1 Tax=Dryococelus australis TaxID=614101 RepID=A0ABQ9I8Y0_9NEOP|nr:hypothetical protein PR048_005687 [Dryococelus australis]